MAEPQSDTEFYLETIKSLYNNPPQSDAVLEFNGVKYYLILSIVKHFAPLLHAEFDKASTITETEAKSDSKPEVITRMEISDILNHQTCQQVMSTIRTIVDKMLNKRFVKMTHLGISDEVVDMILGSMYGKHFEIPRDDPEFSEFYILSTKFGMAHLVTECRKIFKQDIKLDTVIENYENAIAVNSPFVSEFQNVFTESLSLLTKTDVLNFVEKLDQKIIEEIVSSDKIVVDEYFKFEMISRWLAPHEEYARYSLGVQHELMSHVKFELIPVDLLKTHVRNNPLVDANTYIKEVENKLTTLTKLTKLTKEISSADGIILPLTVPPEHTFALGKYRSKYAGYHLVTVNEIKTDAFQKLFKERFIEQSGIYVLDDFDDGVIPRFDKPNRLLAGSERFLVIHGEDAKQLICCRRKSGRNIITASIRISRELNPNTSQTSGVGNNECFSITGTPSTKFCIIGTNSKLKLDTSIHDIQFKLSASCNFHAYVLIGLFIADSATFV